MGELRSACWIWWWLRFVSVWKQGKDLWNHFSKCFSQGKNCSLSGNEYFGDCSKGGWVSREFAQGTQDSPWKCSWNTAGSPINISIKHWVAEAVVWLWADSKHRKGLNALQSVFPLPQKLIGVWYYHSSWPPFSLEALLQLHECWLSNDRRQWRGEFILVEN